MIASRDLRRLAADPKGSLGPSSTKAYAQSLEIIRENLASVGITPADGEGKEIPKMIVGTLTDEEEARIRASVESELAGNGSLGDADTGEGSPHVSTSPPLPTNDSAALDHARGALPNPLPAPQDLRALLTLAVRKNGMVYLRVIAGRLGLDCGRGEAADLVIDKIVSRAYQ